MWTGRCPLCWPRPNFAEEARQGQAALGKVRWGIVGRDPTFLHANPTRGLRLYVTVTNILHLRGPSCCWMCSLEQCCPARTLTLSRGRIWSLHVAYVDGAWLRGHAPSTRTSRGNLDLVKSYCSQELLSYRAAWSRSCAHRARTATFLSKRSSVFNVRRVFLDVGENTRGRRCMGVVEQASMPQWARVGHVRQLRGWHMGTLCSHRRCAKAHNCRVIWTSSQAPKSRTSTIRTSAGPPDATGVGFWGVFHEHHCHLPATTFLGGLHRVG